MAIQQINTANSPRQGENNESPQRSSRYCYKNGLWYFNTREGKQYGPYISTQEMETELKKLIDT